MEKKKRLRGLNFTDRETSIMMDLILKEIHIIETRQNDTAALTAKKRAWYRVHERFEALTGSERTTESLKVKYDNIKRHLRHRTNDIRSKSNDNYKIDEYEEKLNQVLNIKAEDSTTNNNCIANLLNGVTEREEVITQPDIYNTPCRESELIYESRLETDHFGEDLDHSTIILPIKRKTYNTLQPNPKMLRLNKDVSELTKERKLLLKYQISKIKTEIDRLEEEANLKKSILELQLKEQECRIKFLEEEAELKLEILRAELRQKLGD